MSIKMSLLIIAAKILVVLISAEDVFSAPSASLRERLSRFSNAPWVEIPLPLSLSGPPVNVPLPLPLPLPLGPPPVSHPPLPHPTFLCNWPSYPHRIYPDLDGPPIISDDGPWIVHHPPWWRPWRPRRPFFPRPPCGPCGKPPLPTSSPAPSPAAPADGATEAPADSGREAGGDGDSAEEPASTDTAGDGGVVAVNGDVNPAAVPDTPPDPPADEAPAADPPADEAPAADPPAEEAPAAETPAEEAPPAETPAEEAPAAETPAEEAPAEEAPAEEAPAEEAPAEEAPAEEALAEGEEGAALKEATKEQSGEETERGQLSEVPEGSKGDESGEMTTQPPAAIPMRQEVSPAGSSLDTDKSSDKVDQTLNEVPDDTAGKTI